MEKVTTLGIDLAKRVFALHGLDGQGGVVLRKTVRREQLVETVAALPPCLIGMEACSEAHELALRFQELGHTVRLMAPVFVAPYRKSGKNDATTLRRSVRRWRGPTCALCRSRAPRVPVDCGESCKLAREYPRRTGSFPAERLERQVASSAELRFERNMRHEDDRHRRALHHADVPGESRGERVPQFLPQLAQRADRPRYRRAERRPRREAPRAHGRGGSRRPGAIVAR